MSLYLGYSHVQEMHSEFNIKKIALIGPESTGKTTLCASLAAHYKTVWVPEISRSYIGALERKYTLKDIEYCTKAQLKGEEELLNKANGFLFCDSEMIIAKVWCEDVFKTVPEWIENKVRTNLYDLHLLTLADIPFEQDNVRENAHRREFFYNWYKRELDERSFPYEVIEGNGEERFRNSIAAISKHFP
jgi:NadR type nicotinamide-nucleotide adenylyltransferase